MTELICDELKEMSFCDILNLAGKTNESYVRPNYKKGNIIRIRRNPLGEFPIQNLEKEDAK